MRTAIRARSSFRPPKSRAASPASSATARTFVASALPSKWGGLRAGAGRPPSNRLSSEPHKKRPAIAVGDPVIVVARVVRAVGDLRRARAVGAVERAIDKAHARADFRIVGVEVTGHREHDDHALELRVEADDRVALARGMQGFQVAAARALNALSQRRGPVFADRYRIVRR